MGTNYSKNFLFQVVFQATFQIIPSLKTHIDSGIKELIKNITGKDVLEQKSAVINVNIGITAMPSTETTSLWVSIGNDIQVIIQQNMFQIINLKYTTHEDFHDSIEKIFTEIKKLYNPSFTKFSIRYVNRISLSGGATFDFSNLINSDLLSATLLFSKDGLTRSMGSMEINDSDAGLGIIFRFGFYNSEYPNKIAKREFTLDFDVSTEPLQTPIETVRPFLSKIRTKANYFFDKSIEQGLKDLMI